jgi:hypothetical protein
MRRPSETEDRTKSKEGRQSTVTDVVRHREDSRAVRQLGSPITRTWALSPVRFVLGDSLKHNSMLLVVVSLQLGSII